MVEDEHDKDCNKNSNQVTNQAVSEVSSWGILYSFFKYSECLSALFAFN